MRHMRGAKTNETVFVDQNWTQDRLEKYCYETNWKNRKQNTVLPEII